MAPNTSDATEERDGRAQSDSEGAKNRPAYTRWFSGGVFLRVWKNEGERGSFYNLTVVKKWKRPDAERSDPWQETDSFTEAEALVAAEALRLGWLWVEKQRDEERQSR